MIVQEFFETTLLILGISFCIFVIYDYVSSNRPKRKVSLWNLLSRNVSDTGERDTPAFIAAIVILVVMSIVLIRNILFR